MKPDASAGLKDETNVVKNCGAAVRRPAAMLYSAATGCGCSLASLSLDSSSLAERNSGSGSAAGSGLFEGEETEGRPRGSGGRAAPPTNGGASLAISERL